MRSPLPSLLAPLALAYALAACSFIDDFGKFEIGPDDGDGQVDADGGSDGGSDGGEALACPVDALVGGSVDLSTVGGSDDVAASCGGLGAPDRTFDWVAPQTTYYRFHTTGSGFETVLSLWEGDCDREELACSAAQEGLYRSVIVRKAEQGERLVAVVDGRSGDSGEGVLSVEPVTCPGIQIEPEHLPIEHTTAGRDPYEGADCHGGDHGARTYRYTAATPGYHRFSVVGDGTFEPSLKLERGPICDGARLQCSSAGSNRRAEVLRYLNADEDVTIVVSGASGEGSYTLDVSSSPAAGCNDGELEFGDPPLELTLPKDGPHLMTTSCGPPSVTHANETLAVFPDLNIRVTPDEYPVGCGGGCTLRVTAEFPFFAAMSELHDTGCAASEVSCVESTTITINPPEYSADVLVAGDGRVRLLTIDRRFEREMPGASVDPTLDGLRIEMTCMGVC